MARRYQPAAGMTCQAFEFTLDPTEGQQDALMSHFGARRFAYNWTVSQLHQHREDYAARRRREQLRETVGEKLDDADDDGRTGAPDYPDRHVLRKEWNAAKDLVCVNAETGEVWHAENSKEAYASGIFDACDAFDRWARDRANGNGRVGFPRLKRRGRDGDRYRITTGSFGLVGRRHIRIPRVGVIRVCENTRKLARLVEKGPDRAKVRSMVVRRRGSRMMVVLSVDIARPQKQRVADPASVVGVDVGVRTLAVVADANGNILARHENPRALDRVLAEIRKVARRKSRCQRGSRREHKLIVRLGNLNARAHNIRSSCLHRITTGLAKSHGMIVVEGAAWTGLARQKNLPGVRTRRRSLADASPGETRRQLRYKTLWYGSELIVADRYFPSSKMCSRCGQIQDIGWAKTWTCAECGAFHDRDDNAAVNLARYPQTRSCGTTPVGHGSNGGRSPVGASQRLPTQDPNPATPPLSGGTEAGTGDKLWRHQDSPGVGTRRCGPAARETRTGLHSPGLPPECPEPRDGVPVK